MVSVIKFDSILDCYIIPVLYRSECLQASNTLKDLNEQKRDSMMRI